MNGDGPEQSARVNDCLRLWLTDEHHRIYIVAMSTYSVDQRAALAMYDDKAPPGISAVELDPFSLEFLSDPYPGFERLLEASPVFWLSEYAIAGVARYEQVRQVLMDWETFSSARGVGMADFARHGRFRLPSIILEVDPPQHTRSRSALNKVLSMRVMRKLEEDFTAVAETMVDALVARREFDGVDDLAKAYPLTVFPSALGMQPDHVNLLLPYGDMVFNSFGPANDLFKASAPRALTAFPIIEAEALRERLLPGGVGAALYECADAGEITADEAQKLTRSLLTAGVDTTVNGLGWALYCLARFSSQWDVLHTDPTLARKAFEEAIRFESPVQTFFRTTTRDTQIDGVHLGEGQKILMFLGAANRDPRKWEQPNDYLVARNASGHVGFGAGIHMCVGQLLARLEGECVLRALAKRVRKLSLAGEPQWRLNNTLRGLNKLPLVVEPA